MATYLQGVTSFIPQFQPFQPDLNFYANALQTKQNQYDSNYKALNNVYGQYFYADLTHGDNIEKKDDLLKAIDFNLKRVSGLDLSLEQNVEQAKQVFKPFYEDKHLMKDMAWTKNTNSQKAYGAGLKNARDPEMRAQYWDTGVRAIDYITEEFKNSSLEETMGIGNVNYTPYVNVMEKAQKIAKDAGLNMEGAPTFSPDGKWMVQTKNGEQLIPQLSHLFEASLGSDPAVIDLYKTQSYVNRKDYAYSNAAQFGGDQKAAEMSYLTESYKMLKAENEARKVELEADNEVHTTKIKEVEKAVEKNNATPETKSYLERLQEAKNISSTLLTTTDNHVKSFSEESGTLTTNTGFENPYGDIESLRWKVDNAMASKLMQKDLGEAANIFAYKDYKQTVTANPYAVQAQAHEYRMQEVAAANKSRDRAADMRRQTEIGKQLVETDGYHWDLDKDSPTYMQAIPKDDADNMVVIQSTDGASTDQINLKDAIAINSNNHIDNRVVPYLTNMLSSMEELKGKLSPADLQTIFSDKNMTIEKFNAELKANPHKFVKGTLGTTKLQKITNNFQKVIADNYNKGLKEFDQVGDKMLKYNTDLQSYYDYANSLEKWKKESKEQVNDHLNRVLDPEMKEAFKNLYDEEGNLISEEQFRKINGEKNLDLLGYEGRPIKINGEYVQVNKENIHDLVDRAGQGWIERNAKTGADFLKAYPSSKTKNLRSDKKYIFDNESDKFVEITDKNQSYWNKNYGKKELFGIYGPLSAVNYTESSSGVYKKLKQEIHNAYNSNVIKEAPIGLPPISELEGAGLTTIGQQGIIVYPKANGTAGASSFRQFKNDIRALDFNKDVTVSFNGPVKPDQDVNKEGRLLLEAMFNETAKNDTDLNGFRLAAQSIAENNANKGAMILYPDMDFLKKHIYTLTDKGEKIGTGFLSEEQASQILEKGISLTGRNEIWKNNVFQSSYSTPIESIINYTEKPYSFSDPYDKDNKATIEKDDVMGGYKFNFTHKLYDPEINNYRFENASIHLGTPQDLEENKKMVEALWLRNRKESNTIFNYYNYGG